MTSTRTPEEILTARLAIAGTSREECLCCDQATLLALKRLRWFEDREQYVAQAKAAHGSAFEKRRISQLVIWEQENPRP